MANTIVVASGKGGVGKSTTTAFLGASLAALGRKTLVIDCDAGMNSLNVILQCAADSVFSWYDVFTEQCGLKDAVLHVRDGLDLINAPSRRLDEPCLGATERIVKALDAEYEYILLDAPAGLGDGLRRAAAGASRALIVATADEISVRGASAVEQLLRECGVTQARLILNRYGLKAAQKGNYLPVDAVINASYVRLIGIVPEDRALTYYSVTKKLKPKDKGAAAFKRIAERLTGKNVPLKLSLL